MRLLEEVAVAVTFTLLGFLVGWAFGQVILTMGAVQWLY